MKIYLMAWLANRIYPKLKFQATQKVKILYSPTIKKSSFKVIHKFSTVCFKISMMLIFLEMHLIHDLNMMTGMYA
jgi:hypothetical protein